LVSYIYIYIYIRRISLKGTELSPFFEKRYLNF
jgi:hypothetical protein